RLDPRRRHRRPDRWPRAVGGRPPFSRGRDLHHLPGHGGRPGLPARGAVHSRQGEEDMSPVSRTLVLALIGAVVFAALGFALPPWLLFTITKAIAFGLVALGIVALMRGGLVSFGQGLYYCVGAYVSGMIVSNAGVTNVVLLLLIGGLSGGVIAGIVSPLVSRYRGIFFAMLSMALSMVLFGVLAKMTVIGGTD